MSLTGLDASVPTRVGVPIGDVLAGMYGAYGVLAALRERDRTSRGTVVRASLLSAIVGVHAFQGTRWTLAGEVPSPVGNHHPSIAPYGLFQAADGPIQIACGTERQWRDLALLLGLERPELGTNQDRVAHREVLHREMNSALSGATGDSWLAELDQRGVPAGKVRTLDQVYAWEQTRSQGLLIDVEHPDLGVVQLPGPPLRFGDLPYAGTRASHLPPPKLGEHNARIAAWLNEEPG